jgi:hypothetical protein
MIGEGGTDVIERRFNFPARKGTIVGKKRVELWFNHGCLDCFGKCSGLQ